MIAQSGTIRMRLDNPIIAADGVRDQGKVHTLKSWPELFQAILERKKRHELRRVTDRNFEVGDTLLLREFDNSGAFYTGRELRAEISYITSAYQPCALSDQALHKDFCILSIELLDRVPWEQ